LDRAFITTPAAWMCLDLRSYLVDSSGVPTPVGTLSGGDTYATGLNSAGTVAGQSFVMFGNVQSFHAYVWTAGTGIVDLTPGASASYACGINTAGDVIGFAGQDAFVATGGITYDLNALPIDGKSAWTLLKRAISINDAGDIFGIGVIGGAERGFLLTNTTINLIVDGGFEGDNPPNLAQPGWISDFPYRQVPATSESNQPHSGTQNGACWATANLDCGLYQEVTAPRTVRYTLIVYAAADRSGGWVGANVNGRTVAAYPVTATSFGNYKKQSIAVASSSSSSGCCTRRTPAGRRRHKGSAVPLQPQRPLRSIS
jgi:hypothetical protein